MRVFVIDLDLYGDRLDSYVSVFMLRRLCLSRFVSEASEAMRAKSHISCIEIESREVCIFLTNYK